MITFRFRFGAALVAVFLMGACGTGRNEPTNNQVGIDWSALPDSEPPLNILDMPNSGETQGEYSFDRNELERFNEKSSINVETKRQRRLDDIERRLQDVEQQQVEQKRRELFR